MSNVKNIYVEENHNGYVHGEFIIFNRDDDNIRYLGEYDNGDRVGYWYNGTKEALESNEAINTYYII